MIQRDDSLPQAQETREYHYAIDCQQELPFHA
jgi:hypothetical protein